MTRMMYNMKSKKLPMVSVVMSTYNEPLKWVKQAIESILQQTYQNIEFVIVIDDPSNFPVVEYINSISSVRVIENKENMGLVKSLNKALQMAQGQYIARMDADDISLPNRIEKQMDFLLKNKLDLCGSNIEIFDEKKSIPSKVCLHDQYLKKVLRYEGGIPHPTWVSKREVYENLGGYRDIDACEDYDFLARAALKGYLFGNLKEITLRYRDNRNSISHLKLTKQLETARLIGMAYKCGKEMNLEVYSHCGLDSHSKIKKISLEFYKIRRRIYRRTIFEQEQRRGDD